MVSLLDKQGIRNIVEVIVHTDAVAFQGRCRDWLIEKEAQNNSLISIVDLIAGDSRVFSAPFWLATVEENGEVTGCGVHAKPDGLVLSDMPERAYDLVFQSVNHVIGPPHRIVAPDRAMARYFASRWADADNLQLSRAEHWNSYWLKSLVRPKGMTAGRLRLGRDDDLDLVTVWGTAYGEEKPAPVDVAGFMKHKLEIGELYLWEDEVPTTIVTLSGRTNHGIRISSVFTPKELRGRGYASIAVATVCEEQFNSGSSFVTLLTQEGDPAERVYERLGFEKIGERFYYMLEPNQ